MDQAPPKFQKGDIVVLVTPENMPQMSRHEDGTVGRVVKLANFGFPIDGEWLYDLEVEGIAWYLTVSEWRLVGGPEAELLRTITEGV